MFHVGCHHTCGIRAFDLFSDSNNKKVAQADLQSVCKEYKHLQKRSNISLRGQDAHVPSGHTQSAREIM